MITFKYRSQAPYVHIDMALSDEFELMPEYFQRIIPKTHPKLRLMLDFHKSVIEEGTQIAKGPTEH